MPRSTASWIGIGFLMVIWLVCLFDWRGVNWAPAAVQWSVFGGQFALALLWVFRARIRRAEAPVAFWATMTAAFLVGWQFSVFVFDECLLDELRALAARGGLASAFVIGLVWMTWGIETASRHFQAQRAGQWSLQSALKSHSPETKEAPPRPIWNPLDPDAWYYGRSGKRLNQSLVALVTYSALFILLCILASQLQGCYEIYEMPAGGGEQKTVAQVVKVQKIIRQKFIVNPFSAILFEVPPIDEVKLQLEEVTEHTYTPGYGQGEGAGFAGGTKRGKVRFIRLEYPGGDWDQDYGIGGDMNMLVKYYELTSHPIAKRTESRRVAQLKNFPRGKSPPVVYMTGQKNISLSKNDIKILRTYLVDNHGMLFGDNGGSRHFHNQFLAMMNRVLPEVRPVPVPLDDVIHRVPFQIPFLPYVAPHGGNQALGWYLEGRWVCYYHPGDIGDAWSDGHAGVSPEIADACYRLGANVLFYAHTEYAKWLAAQKISQ